jgi:hypothetical protein
MSLSRQRVLYSMYHDKTPTALESAVEAATANATATRSPLM